VGQGRGSYLVAGVPLLAALFLVPLLLIAPPPVVAAGLVARHREDRAG
jgi:hypothetical protein